ncbi:Transcription factor CBF/NF-Y/archaeal histone [Phytophthora cinnamomi]|uniref:Transcription factor CBF/NF-Y/archaeal histone n=1 Tax=Phytophthora cinnamomi TaxID=4785 RepID=UPI00355AC98E|nr:Transcription factor CBF/NF-Y/archaeal histone [Phytophthora cinnamomi]
MKQRDPLKGRVKRLLKEQKDMGQVAEAAVLSCTLAVQVFVRDLASKMQQQAVGGVGLTPVELKKSVLASGELRFLHEKVNAIDESDAKYHKPARGKKRTQKTAAKKSTTKKARTTKAAKATTATAATVASTTKKMADKGRIQGDGALLKDRSEADKPTPVIPTAQAVQVEEDDDYDESDSDA